MEIVINDCFGGFSLSYAAVMEYARRKGITLYPEADEISVKHYGPLDPDADDYDGVVHYYKVPGEQYRECSEKWREEDGDYRRINSMDWYFSERDVPRDDAALIAIVREFGKRANGRHASLKVIEIPDDADWEIAEYDGAEHVAEKHRTWA